MGYGEEGDETATLWFDYAPIQGKCRPLAEPEDEWTVENCKEIDDADAALMIQYYKRPKNIFQNPSRIQDWVCFDFEVKGDRNIQLKITQPSSKKGTL